jgi:serine/threonine protein kinase
MKPHPREREAFEQALDLDGEHLEAYLKKLEDESLSLRQRVEELLAQSDGATQEGNFLLSEPENPIDAIGIRVGDEVDGLKILDILGKGGFGVVYLAQQREPRREIALKVIKPGMDSKEVLARF